MIFSKKIALLAIGIPDSAYINFNEDAARRRSEVNNALKSEMEATENGTYVDCPLKFSEDSPHFDYDGLHFSEEGYKFLGESLVDHVLKIISH